jgi:hypothetical protein
MSGYQVVQTSSTLTLQSGAVGNTGTAQTSCPAGKAVVGGGQLITFGQNGAIAVDGSYPAQGGWAATVRNGGATNATVSVTVYAICVFVAE